MYLSRLIVLFCIKSRLYTLANVNTHTVIMLTTNLCIYAVKVNISQGCLLVCKLRQDF